MHMAVAGGSFAAESKHPSRLLKHTIPTSAVRGKNGTGFDFITGTSKCSRLY